MAEEFKRLDRKLVYHGTIIDYYRDTIQVPNGNIAEWDFIGHKGAAAVVPVREDGKLLMVRQWRNALDRYTLEIPAGGLNGADEPPMLAAARGGIKRVLIPKENERDLEEIPDNVKQDLEIYPVRWIDEVLALALQDNPQGFERVSVV